MKTLLLINSSARSARSVTRYLTGRFADAWRARHPDAEIIARDVGLNPPPPINELWIAAAYSDPGERTPAMHEALAASEELIDEIFRATAIVVDAPLYNFGMPAPLKAYADQIVRVGRTFSFNGGDGQPYQPLVPAKPVAIVTSTGAGGYEPGGPMAHLDFLEPHLKAVFSFIGLGDISFVRVGGEEVKEKTFKRAMADAELLIEKFAVPIAPGSLQGQSARSLFCALANEHHRVRG